MIDMRRALIVLANKRPLFHSEADFQHSLAWLIHELLPGASIRLEIPRPIQSGSIHLDICAVRNELALAIELKYKTRALSARVCDEQFVLKDQNARDQGRYDFIKDIQRLEQITKNQSMTFGYAILLTNDNAYWKRPGTRQTSDVAFRLHEGRVLQGNLRWGGETASGTKQGRNELLRLEGSYTIHWEDYSNPSSETDRAFRYISVEAH